MNFEDKIKETKNKLYEESFNKLLRADESVYGELLNGINYNAKTYYLPHEDNKIMQKNIKEHSIFRNISVNIYTIKHESKILTTSNSHYAKFVDERENIPIYDAIDDITKNTISPHKLAICEKLDADFIFDNSYDIKENLYNKFAYSFGNAEDKGFTLGTGINEPVGILNDTKGAIKSHETSSITYDDIIKLYFSLDKQYRKNCKFMMNDKTAYDVRKLKDNDGAYIWNHNTDTILGKEVIINEFMPDDKPIVCGDFSYYYIIINKPISIRTLKEKFILSNQIGYLVVEYIDGVLTNRNAMKYIEKI